MSSETHNPGTQAPSFSGILAATLQAFTRTSAYMDQRENFDSMSTINRPCVRSRQADYGHVLIPPYTGRRAPKRIIQVHRRLHSVGCSQLRRRHLHVLRHI